MTDRIHKLSAMLQKSPDDAFLHFAIAMEHKKAGENVQAVEWFNRALEKDPKYCVAYHQAALAWEQAGELEKARAAYRQGIAAAQKIGDRHTAEEMEAALSLIE